MKWSSHLAHLNLTITAWEGKERTFCIFPWNVEIFISCYFTKGRPWNKKRRIILFHLILWPHHLPNEWREWRLTPDPLTPQTPPALTDSKKKSDSAKQQLPSPTHPTPATQSWGHMPNWAGCPCPLVRTISSGPSQSLVTLSASRDHSGRAVKTPACFPAAGNNSFGQEPWLLQGESSSVIIIPVLLPHRGVVGMRWHNACKSPLKSIKRQSK